MPLLATERSPDGHTALGHSKWLLRRLQETLDDGDSKMNSGTYSRLALRIHESLPGVVCEAERAGAKRTPSECSYETDLRLNGWRVKRQKPVYVLPPRPQKREAGA